MNAQLAKQNFYKAFPPDGIEVVSWLVVMGIGQIITLRLLHDAPERSRMRTEDTAWGPYRTEFFPTCDFKAVGVGEHDKASKEFAAVRTDRIATSRTMRRPRGRARR